MQSLPSQLTLFIGRVEEINEIKQLLANPDCRLLTVVGVGGIGKTRLALQAASQMTGAFSNGVYFVPLQPITSIHFFVSTVADAIGFSLAGTHDAQAQFLNYLSTKELLLIIDNFEHLLEGAHMLTAILAAAPRAKLLVTSREMLYLQEEWLYPIEGLVFPRATANPAAPDIPQAEQAIQAQDYSAVQLFIERARRTRRGFSPEAEMADIIDICQLVEGMPLALELAASWTQSLSCRAIAGEIRHDLDFLATEWRNVPARQRSMRAVFDHAYHLLSDAEQEIFKRMSVFRGGFRREAAERITGASITALGALVSRCLLRWEAAGRYQLHELLRQYAEELLRQSEQDANALDERHCAYYTDFLGKLLPDLLGNKQLDAVHAIEAELENIRAAWNYAVDNRKIEQIGNAVQALALFFEYRCRTLEGTKILEEALQHLRLFESTNPDEMLVAIKFQELAWFYIRMGLFDQAEEMQKRTYTLYEQLGIPMIEGSATDPLLLGCMLATIRGEYKTALRYGLEALQRTEAPPHPINRQYTQYVLAGVALAQGHYEIAKQYAVDAYATAQNTKDRWFMAYCLIEMGNVACAMRYFAAARKHWEESYAIRQEFNDPEGMAVALSCLGEVALRQEQYTEAQSSYERSVALYRNINDRGGLARSLDGLGNALCAIGNHETARHQLREAVELATEIQFVSLTFTILTSIGNLLVQTGNHASGLALMAQVSRHPSSTTTCKARARQLLAQYRESVNTDLYEIVTAQDHIEAVNTLAEMAQIELSVPNLKTHLLELTPPVPTSPTAQPLVDPLTTREMEILSLIVEGLSNQQIATSLFITRGTVKWYTSQIYSKLGIESRTQAIARARELSIIS